jgi:hypothetical protein
MSEADGPMLGDIRDEAARLAGAALDAGLSARLIGGLAFWLRCPSVRQGPYARAYNDMDFAITSAASAKFKALLAAHGYVPDSFFNGLHGATRLYYAAPDGRWSVDVVIDELVMSHRLDLRGRLAQPAPSIPLADLLLTKLQVWEINRKDLGDALCLLADHALSEHENDVEAISVPRLCAVLGADWGFHHTAERNLGKLAELWAETPVPGAPHDAAMSMAALQRTLEEAPKTRGWRLRARIGERKRWYETPEEVGH